MVGESQILPRGGRGDGFCPGRVRFVCSWCSASTALLACSCLSTLWCASRVTGQADPRFLGDHEVTERPVPPGMRGAVQVPSAGRSDYDNVRGRLLSEAHSQQLPQRSQSLSEPLAEAQQEREQQPKTEQAQEHGQSEAHEGERLAEPQSEHEHQREQQQEKEEQQQQQEQPQQQRLQQQQQQEQQQQEQQQQQPEQQQRQEEQQKQQQQQQQQQSQTPVPPKPQPVIYNATWHLCAKQRDECVCPGTLRWGSGNSWKLRERRKGEKTIRVVCDTQEFPDTAFGDESKHCQCSKEALRTKGRPKLKFKIADDGAAEALKAAGGHRWIKCASQWETCACPGYVRWGNANKWLHLAPKKGEKQAVVPCNVDVLPDIAEGDDGKHCQCLMSTATEAVAEAGWRPKYLGCFDDVPDAAGTRSLPKFAGHGTTMDCTAKCVGYKYFGHQSDLQCWCGNKYPIFGKSDWCECDDPHDVGAGVNCVYKIEKEGQMADKRDVKVQ